MRNTFLLLLLTAFLSVLPTTSIELQEDSGLIRRTTDEIMRQSAQSELLVKQEVEVGDGRYRHLDPRLVEQGAPNAPAAPIVGQSPQTVAVQYTAATFSDTLSFPPDTMGAVGPLQLLLTVNGRIRVMNKNTGQIGALDTTIDAFFEDVQTPPFETTRVTDPRVRYDLHTRRWFIVIIDQPAGIDLTNPATFDDNRVLLAVSDGSVITGATVWTFYYYEADLAPTPGDADCFFDYPSLGMDQQALYIGGNVACSDQDERTTVFVIRKTFLTQAVNADLLSGTGFVTAFRDLTVDTNADNNRDSGIWSPRGVYNYDPNATLGYFIGSDIVFGRLTMRAILNPGSTTPTISPNISLTVNMTSFPANVPHLGNTSGANGQLDALDDRLFDAVMRNGRLWTAQNISVDAAGNTVQPTTSGRRVGIRWYELSVMGQTLSQLQSSILFNNGNATTAIYYWIPSMMVTGQGHAALGFSLAGNSNPISAGYAGRLAGDAANTLRTPTTYATGTGNYNPPGEIPTIDGRRWGDYSAMILDPCDDMTLWAIQQYNQAANAYALQVARLNAPPPAIVPGGSIATVFNDQPPTAITITGTAPNGEGFYDTPASPLTDLNCRRRLAVTATNGVVISNIVFNSPTSIAVTVDASGAEPGTSTLTITNPDGQIVTAMITINGAPLPTPTLTPTETPIPPTETETPILPTETETPIPPTETETPIPPTLTDTPAPGAIELLRNRSFEDDLNPVDGLADFWGIRGASGERRLCDLAFARTGLCAFEFRGSGATEDSILQQRADLTLTTFNAGDVLTLRGYARSTGAPNFRVRIIVNYSDGTIQRVQARYNTVDMVYTELLDPITNQPLTLTLDRADVVQIRVLLWSRNSTGRAYFDDFSLVLD